MLKPKFLLRGLLLILPFALLSTVAVWAVNAATTSPTVPTGPISTQVNANFSISNYASYPAGINALNAPDVPPVILLVMSRDEQLFNKAYPDYTDLNDDGVLDTTYLDSFTYNGYFDPNICYSYGSMPAGGKGFYAAVNVSVGVHECPSNNNYWSGNFLNWLAMSRLDIVRWTFYGGMRQTDTATATVLERAEIPVDLHSWAKVYSGTDIANLAPFSGTTTFCNTSGGNSPTATTMGPASSSSGNISTTGQWVGATTTTSGVKSTPFIRAASGAWNDWASNAKVQCFNRTGVNDNSNVDSAKPVGPNGASDNGTNHGITDYVARVQVCQNSAGTPVESFCVSQPNGASKPEGLLQKYSKGDSYEKHFGLVTASAVNARGPGQLRRNVGMLAGNGGNTTYCQQDAAGAGDDDEFDSNTGQFCYKEQSAAPSEGIVYTIDRFQIAGWIYEKSGADAGYYDYGAVGSTSGCYGPSNPWGARGYQLVGAPGSSAGLMCPDFGNPLAAMYATALQYLQGQAASNQDTSGPLPNPAWVDPYGTPAGSTTQRNAQCAACSIILVSSGLNTFDGPAVQTLPSVNNLSSSTITSLTNTIQTNEGLTGNYLLSVNATATATLTVGNANSSDTAECLSANLSSLAALVGICNGAPGQQGGYLISGLSLGAWNASGSAPIRNDGNVPSTFQIKTFGVALSDNLPSFTIKVGSGSISLSPSCRSTPNDPKAASNPGTPTSCYIGSVQIGAQSTYGLNASTARTGLNTYGLIPTSDYPNVGSYYFVWEDSQYGSDHDQDVNNIVSYCVGASCKMPSTVNTTTSGAVAICDPVVFQGAKSTVTNGANNTIYGGVCNSNGTFANNYSPADGDVLIRNQVVAYSSSYMYVGYGVSGTNADGLYETYITNGGGSSAITQNGAKFNCNLLGGTSGTDCGSAPVVQKFTLGTAAPAQPLQTPLWYASKYSYFTGVMPSLPSGADPGNYFFARNAGKLKDQLDSALQSITSLAANNFGNATTPSSSNDVQGNGLSYQVQYYMQRSGVNWTGELLALWTDSNGFQREGTLSNGNQVLDATNAYYIVNGPDTTPGAPAGQMTMYRCSSAPTLTGFNPARASGCSMVSASNPVNPAWDAGTLLNVYYDPSTTAGASIIANNIPVQRVYSADAGSSSAAGQRYIFTYLSTPSSGSWAPNGGNATGTVTKGIQTDFVWNANSCSSAGVYTPGPQAGFCGTYNTTNGTRTGNYSLLNELSPTLAQELVNWVRGVESADYRSRTSISANGTSYTYRLGDIIDSSPMIVSTPAESYDTLYNSASYGSFRLNYSNRRQMIYVGGNDGMLHAFNGGFYLPAQTAATVGGTTANASADPTDYRQLPAGLNLTSGDSGVPLGNNWTLGQEVWAFIPQNLLPHLRWMADKNYTHMFYVDGSPVVSDVQLWGAGNSAACQSGQAAAADIDSAGHVCGWGTVMVVPFRLGGGYIQVDTVGSDGNASANLQTSNPAYVIVDITDPEQPPTVLGEITTASYDATTTTYTKGTFTTSAPSFVVHREQDGNLHFLLAIGSGPGDNGGPIPSTNSTGVPNYNLWCGTNQTAGNKVVGAPCNSNLGVWIYDLSQLVTGGTAPVASFTGPANSFAGDMVAADFNLNFSDEAVYFGLVTNPAASIVGGTYTNTAPFGGALYKVDMNTGPATLNGVPSTPDVSDPSTWLLRQIINTGQPVTVRPTLATDNTGRPMVYFGTGRSYTQNDNAGTTLPGTQQQYIYGVADVSLLTGLPANCQTLPIATSSLFNASTTTLSTSGTIAVGNGSGLANASAATNISSLQGLLGATDTNTTDTNYGCYLYNGWLYALKAGVMPTSTNGVAASAAQPSERVVSSQVLFAQILLTPTYIPPGAAAIAAANSSTCNPIPVPGTSNLYGMNYLTGTADIGMLASFGSSGGSVLVATSLGSGLASSPVLHTSNGTATAAFGLSGGTTLQSVSGASAPQNQEISWREPATNQ